MFWWRSLPNPAWGRGGAFVCSRKCVPRNYCGYTSLTALALQYVTTPEIGQYAGFLLAQVAFRTGENPSDGHLPCVTLLHQTEYIICLSGILGTEMLPVYVSIYPQT